MVIRLKDFQSLIPAEFRSVFDSPYACDAFDVGYAMRDEKEIDREKRRVRFVASDNSVDHHDEIVEAGAFHQDIGVYKSNPVLLAQHNHRYYGAGGSPVIGSVHELLTDQNPVVGVAEFAESPADQHHWLLYRDGHQRAFSVGFRVKDTEKRDSRTVITRGLLLEISAVPVGANVNALVLSYIGGKLGTTASESGDGGYMREVLHMLDEMNGKIARVEKRTSLLDEIGGLGGDDNGKDADTEPNDPDSDPGDDAKADDEEERELAECLEAAASAISA